jgi:hypothetical protein
VIELLTAIAGYLPDPWPSERVLAKKLGKLQPNIHRTLNRARELGLVSTTVRPLAGSTRDGQTYHLLCLSEGLRAAIARYHFQISLDIRSKNSYSVGVQDEPTSSGGGISRPAAPAVQKEAVVVPFNRPRDDGWDSPAFGEDPKGSLPATTIRVDPAVYLARQFDSKWAAARRAHPALRVIRSSSRGRAVGNARAMMRDNGLSPEHIEAYIDAFIEAAAAGDVVVKEGQFAWERFFGWWGTTDVEDPAVDAGKRAHAQWAIEEARRIRGLTNG